MTWPDYALAVVMVLFLAAGARFGSIWTLACLSAGVAGGWTRDTYGPAIGSLIPSMSGATIMGGVAAYAAAVAVFLAVGWLAGKMFAGLLGGLFDSALGILTGLVIGTLVTGAALIWLVPSVPSFEKKDAWERSRVARPAQEAIRDLLGERARLRTAHKP